MEKFKEECCKILNQEVDLEKTFAENDFDSLDLLQLIINLESTYRIDIPDENCGDFRTPLDVYNFVKKEKEKEDVESYSVSESE